MSTPAGRKTPPDPPVPATQPRTLFATPPLKPLQKAAEAPVPQDPPPSPKPQVPAPAAQSRLRRRHVLVLLSFLVLVVLPVLVSAGYLWLRAADQYASHAGFSVRSEDTSSAVDSLLGPLQLGGSSSASDAEVLYQFIQSRDLVDIIDQKLDLRAIWSRPRGDPVFAYRAPGTIEDLHDHWDRKVTVVFDRGSGVIELRVLAFAPEDAKAITDEIFAQSGRLINEISAIAREDSISYSRDELEKTVERLKEARAAVTAFRNRTQIVDPTVDIQNQAGLLSTLNQQLAAELIELDILREIARAGDQRLVQAERRVRVIEARIAQERQKLGLGEGDTQAEAFATLVGEFERLAVEREFAEQTYTAALANFDRAQSEAQRQTRYLAAHLRPTIAEKSQYPERLVLLGIIALLAFLIWSVLILVAYSLRDRR